jgi:hypothetical protein
VPGDEPGFVVASGKLDERGSQLFDGVEGPHPQQVLLQGSDESLCDAVALGLAHEGGRSFDSQAFDFVLEIAGLGSRGVPIRSLRILTPFSAARAAFRDSRCS